MKIVADYLCVKWQMIRKWFPLSINASSQNVQYSGIQLQIKIYLQFKTGFTSKDKKDAPVFPYDSILQGAWPVGQV